MSVFCITALACILVGIYVAYENKVGIGDGIAVSTSGLILILYVLAFFGAMKGVLVVSILVIAFCIYRLCKKNSVREALIHSLNPSLVAFVIFSLLAGALVSGHVFTWWDDINFWSSDAKQFYYLNGFPGKYGNVSPEFGDYPPVLSLFKWLFLQISSSEYHEGLQFSAYLVLNAIFLLPLCDRTRECIGRISGLKGVLRSILEVVCFVAVMMLPGVFNGIIFYGTPSDITMGIVYGALLLAIYRQEGITEGFYYFRIFLYTAVLLLTKSVGIEWAVFALVFYFLMARKNIRILWAILGSGAVYGSWLLFCLINRRVAKLTGAGIKMATSGTYTAPLNTMDKAKFFVSGFWTMPMHADRNLTLDLSTGLIVVVIFALLIFMLRKKIFEGSKGVKMVAFMIATALLTYGIIFLAHISIFQGEDQYLDAYAMAVSIARYGFPFSFGSLYFLLGELFDSDGAGRMGAGFRKWTVGCLAGFICFCLLTADYVGMYKHLWGYRATVNEDVASVYDMVGDDGRVIVSTVQEDESLWGKRVLVMRDGHTYHWVHDAYISREASPVALVYDSFLAESEDSSVMSDKIMQKHASFLYVEDTEGISAELFGPLMEDGENFAPGNVYRVIEDNGRVKLTYK